MTGKDLDQVKWCDKCKGYHPVDYDCRLVICNHAHDCRYDGNCMHRTPHKPKGAGCERGIGGVAAECPSGQLTICVFLEDDIYQSSEVVWCDHCGGKGRWTEHKRYRVDTRGNIHRLLDSKKQDD